MMDANTLRAAQRAAIIRNLAICPPERLAYWRAMLAKLDAQQ